MNKLFNNKLTYIKSTYTVERRFSYHTSGLNINKLDYLEEQVYNGLILKRWDRKTKVYTAPYADVIVHNLVAWTIT